MRPVMDFADLSRYRNSKGLASGALRPSAAMAQTQKGIIEEAQKMTSSSRPRYTLLIPTYNRPAYLHSLLGYLAARHFEYPIKFSIRVSSRRCPKTGKRSVGRDQRHPPNLRSSNRRGRQIRTWNAVGRNALLFILRRRRHTVHAQSRSNFLISRRQPRICRCSWLLRQFQAVPIPMANSPSPIPCIRLRPLPAMTPFSASSGKCVDIKPFFTRSIAPQSCNSSYQDLRAHSPCWQRNIVLIAHYGCRQRAQNAGVLHGTEHRSVDPGRRVASAAIFGDRSKIAVHGVCCLP